MIRKRSLVAGGVVITLAAVLWVIWWVYAPYFEARLLFRTFHTRNDRNPDVAIGPTMCGLKYWEFQMNTAEHDLDTWCIRSLYNEMCKRLQDAHGAKALSTYTYSDAYRDSWNKRPPEPAELLEEPWPYQVTVVQLDEGKPSASYLAVTAIVGNDSHTVVFEHIKGTFDKSDRKAVASWALPPEFF